jgi:hypothetical protein
MVSEMIDKICTCGHKELKHRLRDHSPEEILMKLVNNKTFEAIYTPDRMEADKYFFGEAFYPREEVLAKIVATRDQYSSCGGFICQCKCFKADNLKYLENLYERKASSIIH